MPAKPAAKTGGNPSGGSSSQSGSTKQSTSSATSDDASGDASSDGSYIPNSKPESAAAEEAVQEALYASFIDGTFIPQKKSEEIVTISDRLKKESYPAWNGRPTVVFYTCEGATKTQASSTKQKSGAVLELQSSVLSTRAYTDIFNAIKSPEACVYSMFVNLVKVDISNITPEQDPFINKETGPFMGYFNIDGACVHMLKNKEICSSSYNRAISQLFGNPAATQERFAQLRSALDKLETLTRQQYLTNEDLKGAIARARKTSSNKTKRMGSGQMESLLANKSVDEIRVDELRAKIAAMDKDLLGIRSIMHGLTGRAVGCEGCPVCLEKAAAASAVASSAKEETSVEQ